MNAALVTSDDVIADIAHDLTVPSLGFLERRCGKSRTDTALDSLIAQMGIDVDMNADTVEALTLGQLDEQAAREDAENPQRDDRFAQL